MFLLEPSPAILFLAILVISKPLLYRKLRCYKKYCQKILFCNKQTEIINLITLQYIR
jgi:hypothetical protein